MTPSTAGPIALNWKDGDSCLADLPQAPCPEGAAVCIGVAVVGPARLWTGREARSNAPGRVWTCSNTALP